MHFTNSIHDRKYQFLDNFFQKKKTSKQRVLCIKHSIIVSCYILVKRWKNFEKCFFHWFCPRICMYILHVKPKLMYILKAKMDEKIMFFCKYGSGNLERVIWSVFPLNIMVRNLTLASGGKKKSFFLPSGMLLK